MRHWEDTKNRALVFVWLKKQEVEVTVANSKSSRQEKSFVVVDAVVDVTVDVVGIKVVEIIANAVINVIGVALVDVDVVDVGVVDVYVSDFLVGWEPDEVVGFWFFIERRLI